MRRIVSVIFINGIADFVATANWAGSFGKHIAIYGSMGPLGVLVFWKEDPASFSSTYILITYSRIPVEYKNTVALTSMPIKP